MQKEAKEKKKTLQKINHQGSARAQQQLARPEKSQKKGRRKIHRKVWGEKANRDWEPRGVGFY